MACVTLGIVVAIYAILASQGDANPNDVTTLIGIIP
jgi:hypothetical protein